jgi:hypothetical protein
MRFGEHATQTLSDILGGKNRPIEEPVSSYTTAVAVIIGAVASPYVRRKRF